MNTTIIAIIFNLFFFWCRAEARGLSTEDKSEGEIKHPCVNVVTGGCLGEDTDSIITEYYDSGPYTGCVKQQFAIEADGPPVLINRFVYHDDYTEVFDSKNKKMIYRFSNPPVVTDIESYDEKGKQVFAEHIDWNLDGEKPAFQWMSVLDKMDAFFKENLMFSVKDMPTFKEFMDSFFGPMDLVMAGYYDEPLQSGVRGKGEHANVRITFINGILNLSSDVVETATMLSELHGGANVHYVYRPTEGWCSDLLGSAQVKLGALTPQAKLLAETWKQLIQEMGGPKSGGTIYHYAHSVGASDTWNARDLMTVEEKKMIRVVTIGSPFMIHVNGLHSVDNYVSVRDGVCLLDPVGYIKGRLHADDRNVVFIGTWWGIPLIDHELNSPAYQGVLKDLGDKFVKTYGTIGN